MKTEILILALALFVFAGAASTGTFTGETQKEGPETSFLLGFASDKQAEISLEVEGSEDLNITYPEKVDFDPDSTDKKVQIDGSTLPVQEIRIEVKSDDPEKEMYDIPVNVTATKPGETASNGTAKVVHERNYLFKYVTDVSPGSGVEDGLISSGSNETDDSEETVYDNSSKDTTVDQNQSDEKQVEEEEDADDEESGSGFTLVLAAAVVAVFAYTMYEAVA